MADVKFHGKSTSNEHDYCHQQHIINFANGYGVSIIRGDGTYGGKYGLFEIAIIHPQRLCYASPITNNVIGNLNYREVADLIDKVEALPENPYCSHQSNEEYDDNGS